MSAAATIARIEELILTRMLVSSKSSGSPAKVRADLNRLLPESLTSDAWNLQVASLRSGGWIDDKKFTLTESGKARALAALRLAELPPRMSWDRVIAQHLAPSALGVPADDDETRSRLGDNDRLKAAVVAWAFELSVPRHRTIKAAMTAAVCKELGFPECSTFAEVQRAVLSRRLNSPVVLSDKDLIAQLPASLSGAKRRKVGEIRVALVRAWLAGKSSDRVTGAESVEQSGVKPESHFDLAAFAAEVLKSTRSCATGWFGESKVFISHVWRTLRSSSHWADLDLPSFKQRLVEANQARLLELSRADLPELHNLDDVRESETRQVNAVFHFVVAPRKSP